MTDRIAKAVARKNEQMPDKTRSFKLIAVLHTSPLWARPDHRSSTSPPAQLSNFGHFAQAFAARYGKTIDYYQIWDEPNLSEQWGKAFVNAEIYAGLLREAALNIRTTDPEATILAAALAPTLEHGPLNLNEFDYLDQLYLAKANQWFDIVAGQPYGIESEPADPAKLDTLNFRRIELLRQVMLNHGDTDTPIWATAFGWNALPSDWSGPESPWKNDTPTIQANRTTLAIEHARREWPWLGPILAVRWDTTNLADDDPARGFALLDTPPILEVIRSAAIAQTVATPGRYPANHPSGQYSTNWRFALTTTDIPHSGSALLTIPFEGTRLDLDINRGPFRGYLWVTIDGQPAGALPKDGQGRSYIVLYDPLRKSDSVTIAQHLEAGPHTVEISAEGGWGQWAINGWTVTQEPDTRFARIGLIITALLAILSSAGFLWSPLSISADAQALISMWVKRMVAWGGRFGEPTQMVVVVLSATGFYLASSGIALVFFLPLALAIVIRPDLGLLLITFGLSFISIPTPLPVINLTVVELLLLLITLGFIARTLVYQPTTSFSSSTFGLRLLSNLKSIDWAIVTFVILALLVTFFAGNFGVSMFEWRTIVLSSAVFYFLIRLSLDSSFQGTGLSHSQKFLWRLVDALVAGATLQAATALFVYAFTDQVITVEGIRRAIGIVYESPNHLSLFLGRVWPILLAVSLLPGQTRTRRWFYGSSLVVVGLTLLLTFSKGALLLGLPAGILVMFTLLRLKRKGLSWGWTVGSIMGMVIGLSLLLLPFAQTARFYTVFDFSQGGNTSFFRLKLWQASLTMLGDHWFLGVGLDNFLYQYRTYYILPEAWQEPNLSHPHNLILDFGTRLGIGGITILCWFQIAFWRTCQQLYKKSSAPLILGLMGSMAVFLSHGLVDNSFFLVDLAFATLLVIGLGQRESIDQIRSSAASS